MQNWGAVLVSFLSLFVGTYYCMFGDPQIAIFLGLVFVGMTNLLSVEYVNFQKNYIRYFDNEDI